VAGIAASPRLPCRKNDGMAFATQALKPGIVRLGCRETGS